MHTAYSTIADYYDWIFPTRPEKIDFISACAGNPPKKILDVACGSGGDAIALSQKGYDVTAIDLDPIMIERLKQKEPTIQAKIMDMLTIDTLEESYDLIYCVGNSLVHLPSVDDIASFLDQANHLLAENGTLVIQIVNYDRILDQNITQLPTITNKEHDLIFERYYEYHVDNNHIKFRSVLTVPKKRYENEVLLLPLRHKELLNVLESAGFQRIQLYGSFNRDPFRSDTSFPLIIQASK